MIKEDFPSQSFSGLAGESEGRFSTLSGDANDARLMWECPIAEIGAGGQTRISYAIELKHPMDEIGLYETRAMEEGEVIALSEEMIRQKILHHDFGISMQITGSLGVTEHKESQSLDELLKSVDRVYEAKNAGRNTVKAAF